MGFARKYILNVTEYASHGVGADAQTTQYNLAESFSGVTDTGSGMTYSYSAITLNHLAGMSIADYDQRISDFLSYAEVDSIAQRNNLLTEATVDDPFCPDFPCLLNSNFKVYRFLTGVRIVNIGTTYGTAEYTIFQGSISGATWTTIPTFLSLNPTETYTAAVRDNLSGEIICIVTKNFILNNLIYSIAPPSIKTKVGVAGTNSINNTGGQNIAGYESASVYGIEYKIGTTGIPTLAPVTPFVTLGVNNYTQSITGLLPNTTYQYRAYMKIGSITYYGIDYQLKTLGVTTTTTTTTIAPTTTTTTTIAPTTTPPTTLPPFVPVVTFVQNSLTQATVTTSVSSGSGNYEVYYYSSPTFVGIGGYAYANDWSASNTGWSQTPPLASVVTYAGGHSGQVYMQVQVTDLTYLQVKYGKITLVSAAAIYFGGIQWQNTPWV